MAVDDEIEDENKRIRRLCFLVDLSLEYIGNRALTHEEALGIVEGVKRHAISLFPGKEETFDIIYAPRFKRLLNTKFKRS
jgi:hypothetical protein